MGRFIIIKAKINFNDKIYSVSFTNINNKIYICLLNEKVIKILDFNLDLKQLKICDEEIRDNSLHHFNKFIHLFKEFVATSDNNNIIIWKKNSNNNNNYSKIKTIQLNTDINDLLLINNDYFISS